MFIFNPFDSIAYIEIITAPRKFLLHIAPLFPSYFFFYMAHDLDRVASVFQVACASIAWSEALLCETVPSATSRRWTREEKLLMV